MTSRLVLVIGDLHIPDRAIDIPAKFKKLLTPGKIGQTLCLGNLTDSTTYTYLRSISPDLKIVRGRYDAGVVTHGSLRIGFLEGFSIVVPCEGEALLAEAIRLGVDVLCYGGGETAASGGAGFEAFEYGGRFFVNPGSATGTGGSVAGGGESVPSFCLMDIQGLALTMYVYQLRKDDKGQESVGVEKVMYTKKVDA